MDGLKTLLIIGFCFVLSWCNAQQTEFSTLSNTDKVWVDNIFHNLISDGELNMVSVGIIKNGKIVYLKGYGTDIINNQTVNASACTNYRIGSISKTITAVLAMKLMEEGKLDINKNVTQYFSGFPEHNIKIKQLLCHRSGIPDNSCPNDEYFDNNDFFNPTDAIDLFKDISLNTNYPSDSIVKGWYSNYGYNLLGAALEQVGEAPFSQLVYEKITKPLKLPFLGPEYKWNEPYYVDKYDPPSVSSCDTANPIFQAGSNPIVKIDSPNGSYLHHLPSGGFKASVIDITLFAQAIINDKIFRNQSTFELMSERHSKLINKGGMDYGYGLERKVPDDDTPPVATVRLDFQGNELVLDHFYGHRGNIPGGGGTMFFVPKDPTNSDPNQKNGIVILCNRNDALKGQAKEILAKIQTMTLISNTGFKPKYPAPSSNNTNFDGDSSVYGEKIILNNNYSPFFDTFNLVGNEVILNSGFEITSDTNFEIRLTNQNWDCPDNIPGPIIAYPTAGRQSNMTTKETAANLSTKVFPNPTNGSLTLKIEKPEGVYINIYNVFGQKVHAIKSVEHINQLNVADKKSGLYIINLIHKDGTVEYIRFIKN